VTTSRELIWSELKPAAVKKKVVVVGGGVAGCETARIAASRGHEVVLIEKDSELGGQVNIASKAPGRQDFDEITRWFKVQMRLLGVKVMLNTEATADTILSMNPDAVVVATGSKGSKPNVPGADQPNVVNVRDVLTKKVETGKNVLVVALEHYTIGATCADFLASQGKKVEIINEETAIAFKANPPTLLSLMTRLDGGGVVQTTRTGLRRIDGNTVTVYNVFSGKDRTIENVDTVVIADEGRADDSLKWALKGRVKELHVVGQALSPRRLYDCTFDGAEVGRAL
jgi:NADPH-dependent 2,4-dienoyl-CoA reductase/sulfur reductase-like enzyme